MGIFAPGVHQTNELGLGGPDVAAPGYTFKGGSNRKDPQARVPAANTISAASDPYAQWGGISKYNSLTSGFDRQKGNIFSSAKDAASASATTRKSSILDFIDSLRTGQRGVDEQAIQNELAKKQGFNSIMGMVGRGLQSGGVMLANKNAGDSSAAEQLARAYSNIGQRELGKVGNQYELENRQIGFAQDDLDMQRQQGLRKFSEDKSLKINAIVSDARNSLAQLDAAMTEADLPGRLQLEQEKARIKQQAVDTLTQYDQLLQRQKNIRPSSADERRRTAFGLANSGVAAENPFDFATNINTQFQNAGPLPAQLPIFTRRPEEE